MIAAKDQNINLILLYSLIPAVGMIILFIDCVASFVLLHSMGVFFAEVIYGLLALAHLIFNLFVVAQPRRYTNKHRGASTILILSAYIFFALKFPHIFKPINFPI